MQAVHECIFVYTGRIEGRTVDRAKQEIHRVRVLLSGDIQEYGPLAGKMTRGKYGHHLYTASVGVEGADIDALADPDERSHAATEAKPLETADNPFDTWK